jgi:tetratricopeptide (TPR) repeat protein
MQRLLSKYFIVTICAGLLCLILIQDAVAEDTPLNQAKIAFQKGDYEDALRLYEGVTGPDRVAAVIGASRIWVMTGDYSKAEEACRTALSTFPEDDQLRSQLAEILTLTGRSDEAIRVLEPAVSRRIPSVKYLVQFGELLRLRGRRSEAEPYFKQAISFYDRGLVFDAEEVAAVAAACRALERFHDANNLFREATSLDPNNLATHVLWGNLFLEKYNVAEARRSYALVLEQNTKYVPALVGMAQTAGGRAANQFLDSALEINARSVSALETRAGLFIEDDS